MLVVVAVGAFVLLPPPPGPTDPTAAPTATATDMAVVTAAPSPTAGTPSATVGTPSPTIGTPSPTFTASPSPTTPSPSPTAPGPTQSPDATATPPLSGQTLPPEITAQIDEVVAQVPPLRELEPLRDVPYRLLTREQLQSELEQMFEEDVDLDHLATEERLLKRMGLVPPDANLHELLLDLYGASIAAYYRPDTGAFYVVERAEPFGPLDRTIVAHEYTHALQDQHFDLEGTRVTDLAEGDAALAQLAVTEGDATQLMFLWAFEHLTFAEQVEMLSGSVSQTDPDMMADMPPILVRQLEFPYTDGFVFAGALFEQGGWAAIDEAIRTPPPSTEQILHPAKYFAGEQPVAVVPADRAAALGDGWQRVYSQVFGELNVHVWVAAGEPAAEPTTPGMPPPLPYAEVAAGWGGDRMHMYENSAGDWAIVWATAWDSDTDATEFLGRARDLLPTLDGVAAVERVPSPVAGEPDRVVLLIASDRATLDRLGGRRG